MPLTRELERKAKEEIYKWVSYIIDNYLSEGLSVKDVKKYFRTQKSLNHLLKDISYAGRRYFEESEGDEYKSYVKKILNSVIEDRIAKSELTTEKKVIKYDNFLNESVNYDDISVEYLFNDIGYSDDDKDIIADFYDTKNEFVKSEDPKYNVYSVVDFKGDILKNNRTSFKVLLLADYQITKMKQNIIKKIVNGILNKIPEQVEYMGVKVKPHTVIDKGKIVESLDQLVKEEDILKLISKLTKYDMEKEKAGEHFLWKKLKKA